MIVNVFDFTTKFELRQYNIDMSASEENINEHSDSYSLARSLISPNNNDNRTPYIQNCESPEIGDIINGGDAAYENTFLISEIFDDLETNKKDASKKLREYFEYQYADIFSGNKQDDNFNIVLIPDVFSPITQEHILSTGVFRRENTILLWRSVASVIGIDFEKKGAAEGDNVLVVDSYFGKCYGTILTLKKRERNGKVKLVPQRKAYIEKNKITNYPCIAYSPKQTGIPDNVFDFFLRTFWGTEKERFYAPTNGIWSEYDIPKIENRANITRANLDGIKYCVVLGNIQADLPSTFHKERIVFDYDCSSTFKGAAKFYYKHEKKFPTYLDQREALTLVIQDSNENIIPKTLIEQVDQWGDEEKKGIENKDCYLNPQEKSVEFYLILGDVDENSELKKLKQDIGKESLSRQNLTLTSSMIPGQGIAIVQVDAKPLIKDRIKLDFWKMENTDETIKTLQEKLKRSFPVDMPKVKADSTLWNNSILLVKKYLNDGINFENRDHIKKMFAKGYSNTKATGIERFRRKNVFGNESGHEIPDVNKDFLSRLYEKLHDDYFNLKNTKFQPNIVNIIAWMYISDKGKPFKDVVDDVLEQVEQAADSNKGIPIQYLTFCANTLTSNDLVVRYFNASCLRLKKSLVDTSVTSTHWIRCLGEMLMFNNDMLSIFSDCEPLTIKPEYTCADCMWYLIKTFELWTKTDRDVASFRYILKAMLFLLKYRKYDKSFIRKNDEATSELYNTILAATDIEKLKNLSCFDKIKDLVCSFRNYIEGKGTLEGIPMDKGE